MSEDQKPGDDGPLDPMKQFLEGLGDGVGDAARELFASMDEHPMKEAMVSLHTLYQGILTGGFNQAEALSLMGAYLYQIVAHGESD
jgi:hypothetical protein